MQEFPRVSKHRDSFHVGLHYDGRLRLASQLVSKDRQSGFLHKLLINAVMFCVSVRSAATLLARCVRMFPGRCASPRVPRQISATLVRTLRVQGASSNASSLPAPTSSTEKQGVFKLYPIIFYLYIVCLFPLPDFYETKIIIKYFVERLVIRFSDWLKVQLLHKSLYSSGDQRSTM